MDADRRLLVANPWLEWPCWLRVGLLSGRGCPYDKGGCNPTGQRAHRFSVFSVFPFFNVHSSQHHPIVFFGLGGLAQRELCFYAPSGRVHEAH